MRSFPLLPLGAYGMRIGREGLSALRSLRPEDRSSAPEQREDRGKTAAARRRRNVRHSAGRTDTQTPQTRGRPRVYGGHRTRSCQFSSLRRPRCCAAGKKSATWPDEGGHILGCCPQRPLHIADEALGEPGGSPSGEEGPLSGGLARDLFLKELRARIGEKWGLLPDGDAAGFPLLFFVRRIVLRASASFTFEKYEARDGGTAPPGPK